MRLGFGHNMLNQAELHSNTICDFILAENELTTKCARCFTLSSIVHYGRGGVDDMRKYCAKFPDDSRDSIVIAESIGQLARSLVSRGKGWPL